MGDAAGNQRLRKLSYDRQGNVAYTPYIEYLNQVSINSTSHLYAI